MALDTILIQREFTEGADEKRRGERVAEIVRKALGGELRLKEMIARHRRAERPHQGLHGGAAGDHR